MTKEFLSFLQKILFFLVLGFLLTVISWSYLNYRQALQLINPERSITLSGEGKIYAKPDIAVINFSVITQGKEAKKVQEENNLKMSKVISLIKEKGINEKDLRTILYQLEPQYDYTWCLDEKDKISAYRTCPPKIDGYLMRQNVEITIRDFQKIDEIMNILIKESVEEVSNVIFKIEDPENYKNLARIEALNKIQERAKLLSSKTGIKLGRILEITETPTFYPLIRKDLSMTPESTSQASIPVSIEAGEEEIQVVLTVKYEIK